jgi:hypothetical protein
VTSELVTPLLTSAVLTSVLTLPTSKGMTATRRFEPAKAGEFSKSPATISSAINKALLLRTFMSLSSNISQL